MRIGVLPIDYKNNVTGEYLALVSTVLRERPEGRVRTPLPVEDGLVICSADVRPPCDILDGRPGAGWRRRWEPGSITVEKEEAGERAHVTYRHDPDNALLIKEVHSPFLNIGISVEVRGDALDEYRVQHEWALSGWPEGRVLKHRVV